MKLQLFKIVYEKLVGVVSNFLHYFILANILNDILSCHIVKLNFGLYAHTSSYYNNGLRYNLSTEIRWFLFQNLMILLSCPFFYFSSQCHGTGPTSLGRWGGGGVRRI